MSNQTAVADDAVAYRQSRAARIIGVSVPTLRRWTCDGLVHPTRIGGVLLYSRRELELVAAGETGGENHAHGKEK